MTNWALPDLAVVIPCYNEKEVLRETLARVSEVMDSARDEAICNTWKLYFVDDGSSDGTWQLIETAAAGDARVEGLKLSRNRGHQNALLAGLLTAEGDVLISMDADLQDDVSAAKEMLRRFREGNDIVYGVRDDRSSDSFFKRQTALAYYRLLSALGADVVFNHADYRLMSRRAVEALRSYQESNLFLRGVIPTLGFPTSTVTYTRSERFAGESKYPLKKMIALALDGITSFSAVPLRLIAGLGLLVFLASMAMSAWALGVRLFTDQAVPGWASSVLPIYLLGGIQLLSIGAVGEYVAKIYMEVKKRPRFFIEAMTSAQTHSPEQAQAVNETVGENASLP